MNIILALTLTVAARDVRFWAADGARIDAVQVAPQRWVLASKPRYIGVATTEETCGTGRMTARVQSRRYTATIECGRGMRIVDLKSVER